MLSVFAVYDSKACAFGMPICVASRGLALRSFSDACAAPNSPMGAHPEDYVLFEIGGYDQNSGKLSDITPAVHVASASAVVSLLDSKPGASSGDIVALEPKASK